MKFIFILFTSLFLSSCASLPTQNCDDLNWLNIGENDGRSGKLKSEGLAIVSTCKNKTISEKYLPEYEQGWSQGHLKYCTEENGYLAGLRGLQFADFCSDSAVGKEYFQQYVLGHNVKTMNAEKIEIQKNISEANADNSDLSKIGRVYNLFVGRDPNAENYKRIESLNSKINMIENNAPGGPRLVQENFYDLSNFKTSDILNYTGVFFGSINGFGVGHIFQGRYLQDGWKWTLGEISILAAMASLGKTETTTCAKFGSDKRCDLEHPNRQIEYRKLSKDEQLLQISLMFGWIGYKVWQGVDLYNFAQKDSLIQKSQTQYFLFPNSVQVVYGF